MPGNTRQGALDGTQCKDCTAPIPLPGEPAYESWEGTTRRCKHCAKRHREAARARTAEMKQRGKCVVCGKRAARVGGKTLTVCSTHREYYRERASRS